MGVLSAGAQERLTGIVTNAATGRTLQGARVVIQGSSREAITDDQGVYRFSDAPAGNVALSVSYTGLETSVVPAVVTTRTAKPAGCGTDL